MKNSPSFALAFLAAGAVLGFTAAFQTPHLWLKGDHEERINKLAEHFRGNEPVMMEVNYRHNELYKAIKAKQIDYANYQVDKMVGVMKLGAERRPKRKDSYQWFFDNAVPAMKDALLIEKGQMDAFKVFTKACVTCHEKEKIPTIPVPEPWKNR
jgi:hypothetical protein